MSDACAICAGIRLEEYSWSIDLGEISASSIWTSFLEKHFPLTGSLAPLIVSMVKAANAYESSDPIKAVYEYFNRAKKHRKEGIKTYVDDRFPDFRKYAERSWDKLNHNYVKPVSVPDMSTRYNLK